MMNLMVMNSAVKSNILKTFIVYVKKNAVLCDRGCFYFCFKIHAHVNKI